jgi:hypothetical protein
VFGSTILDVVLGIIFSFLVISLVTSAVTETIASAMSWRANTLLEGVKQLLNDPQCNGLALKIYNHAAVNARSNGSAVSQSDLSAKPSYIDPKQFADALMDVAQLVPGTTVQELQTQIDNAVPDPQLNKLLKGIVVRAGGDINCVRDEIGAWFNAGMDRVAGAYKRKTQFWGFCIGLTLAIVLNVDTAKIAQALWSQPMIMKGFAPPPSGETAQQAIDALQNIGIPYGWNGEAVAYFQSGLNWIYVLVGWLITAIATLFGAPFWFDSLQKVVQLRGAGSK